MPHAKTSIDLNDNLGQTDFHKHKAAAAVKWLTAAAVAAVTQQSCSSALAKERGELYEYNYLHINNYITVHMSNTYYVCVCVHYCIILQYQISIVIMLASAGWVLFLCSFGILASW